MNFTSIVGFNLVLQDLTSYGGSDNQSTLAEYNVDTECQGSRKELFSALSVDTVLGFEHGFLLLYNKAMAPPPKNSNLRIEKCNTETVIYWGYVAKKTGTALAK